MIVSTSRSVQTAVEGTDATDLVRAGGGLKAIGLVGGEHGPLADKTASTLGILGVASTRRELRAPCRCADRRGASLLQEDLPTAFLPPELLTQKGCMG